MLYFLVFAYTATRRGIKEESFHFYDKADDPFMYSFMKWTTIFIDVLLSIAIIYFAYFALSRQMCDKRR